MYQARLSRLFFMRLLLDGGMGMTRKCIVPWLLPQPRRGRKLVEPIGAEPTRSADSCVETAG